MRIDARGGAGKPGDLTHPAVSPYRDRPIEESLDLLQGCGRANSPTGA